MRLKISKNGEKLVWTKHSKRKRQQYQLSERRLRRVLRKPDRTEKGIAPETIAVMQRAGTQKHPTEIWLMYQVVSSKRTGRKIKVISAWRYPGISPIGEPIPIPEDTLEELDRLIKKQ
jgi:hypothetical protein